MGQYPVFQPVSPLAKAIFDLTVVVGILCAVIFVIVASIITYSLLRYRSRPGAPEPPQTVGHKTVEIVWTLVPLLLVAWLFIISARAMNGSDPAAKPENADLTIIGHQWWWEARYPQGDAVAVNEIHIPTGQRLLVRLQSADVIHDFWPPQLSRKMDVVPGQTNYMWLQADRPGTYPGACAEYCGAQHAWMWCNIVAEPPAEFEAWRQRQLQPLPTPSAGSATHGAKLFQQLTCVNCHAINGTGARVQAAPDLTHLSERRVLAAGVLPNTRTNLAKWLLDPQSFKPGCLMPNLHLTQAQAADLVNYLEPEAPTTASNGKGTP